MGEAHDFEFGSLTPEQLAASFAALPADITFADAEGVIRYYSAYRIFSRSERVLGTLLLDCHGSSREMVAEMLADFEAGTADEHRYSAEKDGRPVQIHDIAVRGANGAYVGCIEVAYWGQE